MKKTLFILLAVMALCALLIVPASAEEAHTGHCVCGGTYDGCDHADIEGDWIAWDGTTNITAGGNYYLTAPVTTQRWLNLYNATNEERIVINLCLNGISCDSQWRVFGIGKNVTVNLMNCSETTSVLKGNCATNDNGKVIIVHQATSILNMYGNIRLEGKTATDRTTIAGGAVVSNGVFNMYGGEIVGTYVGGLNGTTAVHAGRGGAVMLNGGAEWNLYGGTVIGGSGGQYGANAVVDGAAQCRSEGGVAYISNNAKWNMYGGTVYGGIVGDGAVAFMTGDNAKWNIYGGTIHAGNAAFGGGVAKVAGSSDVVMSGGVIDGTNTLGKNFNAGGAGGGAFMLDSGNLTVNGTAEIKNCSTSNLGGAIKVMNANSVLTLGGSAKIHSNGSGTNAASNHAYNKNRNENIYLMGGMKPIVVEDTVTEDAYFGISMATPGVFTAAVSETAAKAFVGDGGAVTQLEDGTLSLGANAHADHCHCGGASEFCEEHQTLTWTAYAGGNITTSGNYYLPYDFYGSQIQIGSSTAGAEKITVNFCFHGNDLNQPGFRMFIVWGNATVNFSNCKGESGGHAYAGGSAKDHTGIMMLSGTANIYEGVSLVRVGENVAPQTGGIQVYAGATLNLYGGTIKGGPGQGPGSILVNSGATFNMYGGLVYGGTAVGSHGGNIYVKENGYANFYGGIVRDGTVLADTTSTADDYLDKNGGNLAMLNGSIVNITGDTQFIGGTANRGGNIFLHKGTLNISGNAKIIGGTATNVQYGYGANGIHVNTSNSNGAVVTMAGTPEISEIRLDGSYIVNKGMEPGTKVSLSRETNGLITDSYVSEEVAAGFTYNDPSVETPNRKMYYTRTGLVAGPVDGAHYHCLCARTDGTHSEGCDGIPVLFTEWNGQGNLVDGNGGYYLNADVSKWQSWIGATSTGCHDSADEDTNPDLWGVDRNGDGVAESGYEVTICMNGHNRTSNGRSYGVGNGGIFNLVNCSTEGGQNIAAGANNTHAGAIITTGKNHIIRLIGNVSFSRSENTNEVTNAGLLQMSTGSKLIIDGATLYGGTAKNYGGAVYLDGAEMVMYDGTIVGSTTANGGSIYGTNSKITIYDGHISGGTARNSGGNIFITYNSTFNMYGGVIENGTATGKNDHGGNMYVHNDCQGEILGGIIQGGKSTGSGDANGGNIAMSDTNNNGDLVTLTIGGNAQILGGQAYRGANVFFHSGILTVQDNAVITAGTLNEEGVNPDTTVLGPAGAGLVLNNTVGTNTNPEGIIILKGKPQIAELQMMGPVMDASGLEAGASIGLDCDFAGKVTTSAISDDAAATFTYLTDNGMELYNSEFALLLITPGNDVLVDGESMPIEAAVIVCEQNGKYITLSKDLNGEIGIPGNAIIDLAGYDISGEIKVASGCALSVFDSTNVSLTEAAEGYGKISAKFSGTLNRSMNTPAAYGHNYKVIAVKEADGSFSFHRIYLTVKSVVFTPYDTGVNFKTVLKCNDVVAKYLHTSGYGVSLNGSNYYYPNASVTSGSDNLKLVKVLNVLGTADMLNLEKAQTKAETTVEAQAIIRLTDGTVIKSAGNGKSLLELVASANESFAELTDRQQAALSAMYETFNALMSTWDDATVGNIRGYQNADPDEGAVYHCYCYGTDAASIEATACAKAGHPEVKWLPWNRTNTVPAYGGNYYLTADVTVYGTSYLQKDALVAIDLNGYTITSQAWNDVADITDKTNIFYLSNENSALIITDSVGGGKIIPSGDTNWQTGLGMAVRVTNVNSSFSLYAGTIDATDIVADYGVAIHSAGTVNMYGGAITGGISGQGSGGIVYTQKVFNMYGGVIENGQQLDPLTEQRNTRGGGNVRMGGGVFNMYGGTIQNGYAVGNGGNIRIADASVFNLYGGSIKGGVADTYAGNVYVGGNAQFNIYGGSVEGGYALRGGNFLLLNNAKLTMTDGSILGGYVAQTGGSIRAEGNTEITISGGKVIGMTADELAAIPVEEDADPISAAAVNGGLFFLENNAKATVSGKATITGGIAGNYGGTAYLNASSVFTINGATVNAGYATNYGGGFALNAKAALNLNSGVLNGGSTNLKGGRGGTIYMAATDVYDGETLKTDNGVTFNMTGGTIYGGNAYNGAAIYAREESVINMSAGTLYAGEAVRGGGAAKIEAGCVFNMNGTAVIDGANPYLEEGKLNSGNNGGGLFVDSSTFNMSGDAIIQNCIAANKGGGIIVNNEAKTASGCVVNLSGNAQVINNSTASTVTNYGGGIVLNASGKWNSNTCFVNVSGNVQVTGNYDGYGLASDVSVLTGTAVTVAGNLGSNASIGIYNADPVFANGTYATSDNAVYFYSNIDPDVVATASDNQLSFAASFLVGYAVADINPTSDGTVYGELMEGIGLSGYSNQAERIATSVDEELGLQASVLIITGLDGETICIVSYDAAGNSSNLYKEAAKKITEKTGIPADHIMFNANHQHSTPVSHTEYNALFAENVSNAAVDAMASRAKTAMYGGTVNVNEGYTYSNHFNYVRNYTMLNATGSIVGMVTDNHTDVGRVTYTKLTAESMADDEVQLVKFVREGTSTIIMANFQTHPHLLTDSDSTVVTSDIVGVFRNELKAALESADASGTEYEVMYISGASGNINPNGNSSSYSTDSSDTTKAWSRSSDYAKRLAHAKLLPSRTFTAMQASGFWTSMTAGDVAVANQVVGYQKMLNAPLSWTGKTVEEVVAAAKEIKANGYANSYRDNYGIYSKYHANSIVTRENNKVGDMYDIYLGAFSVGDLAFVSAPYEMFDTNGMEIKEGSPFAMTFINSLSTLGSNTAYSGHIGYIPSALGYANGGYSADISYVEAGTGEKLVADFLEMLEGLK